MRGSTRHCLGCECGRRAGGAGGLTGEREGVPLSCALMRTLRPVIPTYGLYVMVLAGGSDLEALGNGSDGNANATAHRRLLRRLARRTRLRGPVTLRRRTERKLSTVLKYTRQYSIAESSSKRSIVTARVGRSRSRSRLAAPHLSSPPSLKWSVVSCSCKRHETRILWTGGIE